MLFEKPAMNLHHLDPLATTANQQREERLVIVLLLATVTYQAALCFANTHLIHTSRGLVGLAEGLIYLGCTPILARRLAPGPLILALLVGATMCLLASCNGFFNVKAIRDLIIPLCYFWVGYNIGKPELADRALTYVIGAVLALALAETFFLDRYTDVFNIFSYYVSTGNLQPITDYVRESRLQLNGLRPEGIGRTLLPSLLGPHRTSSVFLEPVSLGNFATMCAAWGLSKDKNEIRKTAFFVGMAIVLMVLSDSRFALLTVSLLVAMRFTLYGKGLNIAVLAPFVCVVLVLAVGMSTDHNVGDTFHGRLAISGWSLLKFDVPMLLGASPGENFGDQGYAYAFSNYGLPLCLLMWFGLWLIPLRDERGRRFRAYISVYVSLILCISGNSLFALKSAGIIWFLLGCYVMAPAVNKQRRGFAVMPVTKHSINADELRTNHVA